MKSSAGVCIARIYIPSLRLGWTGTLVTHQGSFGAGSFVWFPEGETMEHGASAAGDVTVLFVTNKPFRIDYL